MRPKTGDGSFFLFLSNRVLANSWIPGCPPGLGRPAPEHDQHNDHARARVPSCLAFPLSSGGTGANMDCSNVVVPRNNHRQCHGYYSLQIRKIHQQTGTVNNRYIVSLAVSDLIIGLEGIPLFTVYVVNGDQWPLGSIACETWLFLDYTLCLVSILTVLLITADRYMSVCHTAKYLKWQSPTKTQVLIIFSWILPALIFGVMIYGWSILSGEEARAEDSTECSAPFLSNPYVNMGMYVAYYWTTLIAMLILYKGIHKAAKNLEKKAKAKEHRHIALLLTQRLGTQVGVSLMLQSKRSDSESPKNHPAAYSKKLEASSSTNPPSHSKTEHENPNNPENLNEQELTQLIEEVRTEAGLTKHTHIIKREPLVFKRFTSPTMSFRRKSRKHSSVRSVKSNPLHNTGSGQEETAVATVPDQPVVADQHPDTTVMAQSYSRMFHDESLSSILQFNQAITVENSNNADPSEKLIPKKPQKLNHEWAELGENEVPIATTETIETPMENGFKAYKVQITHTEHIPTPWYTKLLRRIRRATSRPKRIRSRTSSRRKSSKKLSRSQSVSSSDSEFSSCESPKREQKTPVHVNHERKNKASMDSQQSPSQSAGDLLGHSLTKISNISAFTKDTKDKMISSLFSPISTALNRSRKRTKAERRAHKAFRTITFIVGLFAILWSPYYVVATVYGFCKGQCIPSVLYNLSYYMCYLNSSGNPFAYALANRQFRSAFLRMLRGNFRRVP
ncbi:unnamed protein product [Bursaphelenchus okinawaensis]|uniref:G-protein coupled receptors family 1 profile domain-containing protein n=1 Tax=Bursaphelenchus okinawaensis TaxID=465554 RepID=A0A811KIM9_9BILA|nr:unnamed protein product [Bursaphelenchus okinawaensis]CAG9103693.1 unnamed protein product [Bursaphelenchus okinawaensis]